MHDDQVCVLCECMCGRYAHRVKVLELLAEGEPFQRAGGIESVEAGLEGTAANINDHGHQGVLLPTFRLPQERMAS